MVWLVDIAGQCIVDPARFIGVHETFSLQVDKCSQLLENTLSLYSEAGQTAGQVKSNNWQM